MAYNLAMKHFSISGNHLESEHASINQLYAYPILGSIEDTVQYFESVRNTDWVRMTPYFSYDALLNASQNAQLPGSSLQ